jgi:molybdopterin/thiamine biosynthesis adenylyltransferase
MDTKEINEHERSRYSRQMLIDGWGEDGQARLKASRVFIAGAGGLGSPVSIYLAEAGIGRISIIDSDQVELSNLNRQILHPESRLAESKALSAEKTLRKLNPNINLVTCAEHLDRSNINCIVGQPDLIVDCLDNFDTRHVLNRYAFGKNIPMIHAGVFGMQGQLTVIKTPETPCLWCIQPGSPPSVVFPIVGATAGVIGCIEALEAIKYLSGVGTNLMASLLIWDGARMEFTHLPQKKLPGCPVCGGQEINP